VRSTAAVLSLLAAACSSSDGAARHGRDPAAAAPPRALSATFDASADGVLVLLRDDLPRAAYVDVARAAGAHAVYRYRAIPAFYARDPSGNPRALAARLAKLPQVAAVSIDRPLAATPARAEARLSPLGNLRRGAGVAVLSSGISPAAGLPLGAACFSAFAGAAGCDDPVGEGTHLARLASAAADDAVLYPVRILDDDLRGTEATLIAGLDWLADHAAVMTPPVRAAVIAVSLGDADASDRPVLAAALSAARRAGLDLQPLPR
jgi:hypothetical protein